MLARALLGARVGLRGAVVRTAPGGSVRFYPRNLGSLDKNAPNVGTVRTHCWDCVVRVWGTSASELGPDACGACSGPDSQRGALTGSHQDSSVDEELPGPFADMRYDAVFKRIFTDREVLLGFLNAVEVAGKGVSIQEIGNVELKEPAEGVRSIIFDIHCKLSNNLSIIIELQRAMRRQEILDRMVGYASKAYAVQWQRGVRSYRPPFAACSRCRHP
jgi:hypothetical protein